MAGKELGRQGARASWGPMAPWLLGAALVHLTVFPVAARLASGLLEPARARMRAFQIEPVSSVEAPKKKLPRPVLTRPLHEVGMADKSPSVPARAAAASIHPSHPRRAAVVPRPRPRMHPRPAVRSRTRMTTLRSSVASARKLVPGKGEGPSGRRPSRKGAQDAAYGFGAIASGPRLAGGDPGGIGLDLRDKTAPGSTRPRQTPSQGPRSRNAGPAPSRAASAQSGLDRNAVARRIRWALARVLVYPLRARRRGLEGKVVLSFRIDAQGRARDVRVAHSAGRVLDRAAVSALHRAEPLPLFPDRVLVPVRFHLED